MTILEIRNLKKSYKGVVALDGIRLEVAAGQILGLLGPNGAGKTTLVSIVAGLRKADSGRVLVGGLDASTRSRKVQNQIGLAPQELGIYPILTVRENLQFFGELSGISRSRLSLRIDEVSGAIGISHLIGRLAGTLSGGEKRRLHTAIALLHRPPLLLLDEPTSGADVRTRQDLLQLVKQLAADGCAVLYSTHYLSEVETLGASVAIIEDGRLIAEGSVAGLIAAHAQAAVELNFEGPAPDIGVAGKVLKAGSRLTILSDNAAETAAQALSGLGSESRRLRSVQVVNPSLESVFLALTGRRYSPGDEDLTNPEPMKDRVTQP